MSWECLSLHFKQTYEGGYRYLDRCGELMMQAVDRFDFLPGEIKVTGAKLEIPERTVTATVDCHELTISQEFPDDNGDDFIKLAEGLALLAGEHLQPTRVVTSGLAAKLYWPLKSAEAAAKASLSLGDHYQEDLGKLIGMVASRKNLDLNFSSGSLDFHVLVRPVTFEKVSVQRYNPSFGASREQRVRIERLNRKADRIDLKSAHAIMMELDLLESDPPVGALANHFDALKKHEATLIRAMVIK
jgi:hypothetical protein